jgi:hypothetical protein
MMAKAASPHKQGLIRYLSPNEVIRSRKVPVRYRFWATNWSTNIVDNNVASSAVQQVDKPESITGRLPICANNVPLDFASCSDQYLAAPTRHARWTATPSVSRTAPSFDRPRPTDLKC